MIAIDQPGFGCSDFGDAQNVSVQSQIIAEFIKKINTINSLIRVGYSVGGPFVAKLALDNPLGTNRW